MANEAVEREGKSYWAMGARTCDSCKVSPALLFCRADSAFLCGPCDTRVHSANKLASRHERVWMCEVCEQQPAAVTCKADASALCFSCDSDIHSANPLARRHERFPVVPFFHSPESDVAAKKKPPVDEEDLDDDGDEEEEEAEAASWLLPNAGAKMAGMEEANGLKPEVEQYFFSDVDPYLDLDYAASMDRRFNQTDSVVPVQTRAAAAAAVIHRPPPFVPGAAEFDFTRSKPSYSYAPSLSHSVSSSEVGVVPDGSAMADISNPYGNAGHGNHQMTVMGHPAPPASAVVGMDREARVMRYREKRKNRRFEKTIRYASRKAYAETRPRIKGRFAKRTGMEGDGGDAVVEGICSSAALMLDTGYGVVPSFLTHGRNSGSPDDV